MIRTAVFGFALFAVSLSSVAQSELLFNFAPAADPQKPATANPREDERYQDATDYLEEENWRQAAEAFGEVVSLKGTRADGALYWKAYALNKLGRRNDALASIGELRRLYPRSKWLKDAGALEVEIKSAQGQRVNPESQSDEELKLMAIQSLMSSDQARAVPMLQRILDSPNNSPRVKDKALFVLAQSDSPQAQQVVAAIARQQAHPELQLKAIQYLGLEDSATNRQVLEQIYRSSTDARVKRAVLQAFITSDAQQSTVAVIREERDPELRRQAIQNLGAMGANAQLRQLYQNSTSVDDKARVLEALGVAGDVNTLSEIARAPGDARLRRQAMQGLGISGGTRAKETLVAIYSGDKDAEIRRAAIEGLFIQDADHELVQLARKETDPRMRREIVEKLAVMGSKEAQDYMLELLNK